LPDEFESERDIFARRFAICQTIRIAGQFEALRAAMRVAFSSQMIGNEAFGKGASKLTEN
jgi:hypothetical protein